MRQVNGSIFDQNYFKNVGKFWRGDDRKIVQNPDATHGANISSSDQKNYRIRVILPLLSKGRPLSECCPLI